MLGGKDTLASIEVTPRHQLAAPRPRAAHIDDRGQALTQEVTAASGTDREYDLGGLGFDRVAPLATGRNPRWRGQPRRRTRKTRSPSRGRRGGTGKTRGPDARGTGPADLRDRPRYRLHGHVWPRERHGGLQHPISSEHPEHLRRAIADDPAGAMSYRMRLSSVAIQVHRSPTMGAMSSCPAPLAMRPPTRSSSS